MVEFLSFWVSWEGWRLYEGSGRFNLFLVCRFGELRLGFFLFGFRVGGWGGEIELRFFFLGCLVRKGWSRCKRIMI